MDRIRFATDTSTLCVFDISALKHRLVDDCDWWSIPSEEIKEVNNGNVAFIGLGSDGVFFIDVVVGGEMASWDVALFLNCPSGRVFVGAGEEVTGAGLEPEAIRGGAFLEVAPGTCRLLVRRISDKELLLALIPDQTRAKNDLLVPVRI